MSASLLINGLNLTDKEKQNFKKIMDDKSIKGEVVFPKNFKSQFISGEKLVKLLSK